MKKAILYSSFLIAFLLLPSIQMQAQGNSRNSVKMIIKESINTGDNYFKNKQYDLALGYYAPIYELNKEDDIINYKLGVCYLYVNNPTKAIELLEKAEELNVKVDDDVYFMLGQAYHVIYDFDKAIMNYRKDLLINKSKDNRDLVNKLILECQSGKILVQRPIDVKITMLPDNVNSDAAEYGSVLIGDSILFFTSRRQVSDRDELNPDDNMYYEDVYSSSLVDGEWKEAVNLGLPVNSRMHDAVVTYSGIEGEIYIYRERQDESNVFSYKRINDKWVARQKMKKYPFDYPIISMSFIDSAKTMYFCGNRTDDNYGQNDIYVTTKEDNGDWSQPVNLGPSFNTKYDENSVFLSENGNILYFSSNGHNSMGGYDIFVSIKDEFGNWAEPQNIGYPVNTPYDDVFFSVFTDSTALYSSSKVDRAKTDIFMIKFKDGLGSQIYDDGILADDDPNNEDPALMPNVNLAFNNRVVYQKQVLDVMFNQSEAIINDTKNIDILVEYMLLYPQCKIQITGNSSAEGSKTYNQTLSEERTNVIYEYLVNKGVSTNNITTKSLGINNPISYNLNSNGTPNKEGRIYNRRTEIVVTNQGDKMLYVKQIDVPEVYRIKKAKVNEEKYAIYLFFSRDLNDSRINNKYRIYNEPVQNGYHFFFVGDFNSVEDAIAEYNRVIRDYPDAFIIIK